MLSLINIAIWMTMLCIQIAYLGFIFFGEYFDGYVTKLIGSVIFSVGVSDFVSAHWWSILIAISNISNLAAAAFIAWQEDVSRKLRVFWMISFVLIGAIASMLVCVVQIFKETRLLMHVQGPLASN
jgi:hypothetical protein